MLKLLCKMGLHHGPWVSGPDEWQFGDISKQWQRFNPSGLQTRICQLCGCDVKLPPGLEFPRSALHQLRAMGVHADRPDSAEASVRLPVSNQSVIKIEDSPIQFVSVREKGSDSGTEYYLTEFVVPDPMSLLRCSSWRILK